MINITNKQFDKYKSERKNFSVISEFRGDEVTPITIFKGFDGARRFILEGGSKENRFGRYSFLGENPYLEIVGDTIEKINNTKNELEDKYIEESSNPFPFKGGAIGYMGYDTASFYEKKLNFKNEDPLNLPIVRFNFYKRYIAYDHFTHRAYVVDDIFGDDDRDYKFIVEDQKKYFKKLLEKPVFSYQEDKEKDEVKFEFVTSREKYIENVKKAKEYIKAGDIFQVVPSLRMYCETTEKPFEIYRRLREKNPSPYMYFIDYDMYQVIGSSPESLVSVKNGIATTNPIAGSIRRGKDEEEDRKLENQLLNDEKEKAEHVMLVDLGRNDIGKISEIGSVEVKDFMKIEKFSHIMHITSKVEGKLREGNDAYTAIASCLPAGTLSGAPKIRAMEIIEELEDVKRGIYSGTVGYFSYDGAMDMCIAIRTIVLKGTTAYIQAGAGIVYDSIPEKEFEETQSKLGALKEALRWFY